MAQHRAPLVGSYFMFKEVFDRPPALSELVFLLRDLDPVETSILLSQINAEFRLTEREREAVAKTQQKLASHLLDDETINRFRARFGSVHLGDRIVFHPLQVLGVLRLVLQHSTGSEKPACDSVARHKVGRACLMVNDLLLTPEEASEISTGRDETKMRALMTQLLGPFEINNPVPLTHLIYRSRVKFHHLLNQAVVVERIKRKCRGFDFERQFLRVVGIPLSRWLFLLFAFAFYFRHYIQEDGGRCNEYLLFDRIKSPGQLTVTPKEIDALLATVCSTLPDLRSSIQLPRPTDWRFDHVPFRSCPLIDLGQGKLCCLDIALLAEKIDSGVYWAINDRVDQSERPKLFDAWGILFEEYVNWFLRDRQFKPPLDFHPSPKWADGTESFDGAFLSDSRFVPMEYKGGLIKMEARYSMDKTAFESDLDLKIGNGCRQLAQKIEALFGANSRVRRKLRQIPLDHVTRVLPVLVVQDQILRGPLVNWWLNRAFDRALDRTRLRSGVTVDSLNLVNVGELETMTESSEGGNFDLLHGLQLRCFRDPEMLVDLHSFLMTIPSYGIGKSDRIEKILDQQSTEMNAQLFGPCQAG
jgi:hypothetical protein